MKKLALLLPVLLAGVVSPALAQEMSIVPRVEARVGYDEVGASFRLDDSAFMEDSHDGGPAFGFEAGADANIGESILAGIYAGVDFSDIDKCDELFGDDELCVEGKHNFALGLRGGLRVGDGGVIYVKGGLSRTKLKASYTDDTDTLLFSGSEKTKGWHIGAGVELAVSGGLYVKGEYVHTRYRNVLEDQLADTDSIDPSRHQIMAGIGFKFGGTSRK